MKDKIFPMSVEAVVLKWNNNALQDDAWNDDEKAMIIKVINAIEGKSREEALAALGELCSTYIPADKGYEICRLVGLDLQYKQKNFLANKRRKR